MPSWRSWLQPQPRKEPEKVGLTKKQRDERAAVKAGTHEKTKDAFGNEYYAELPPKAKQYECVHCGQKAILIVGKQITPGDLKPFRHAPGAGTGCPKNWGPLEEEDVREV